MKSVLLITHDTSLSGAPKSILLIFKELVKKGYFVTTLAIKGGGKLEQQFQQMSNCYIRLDKYSKTPTYTIQKRIYKKIFRRPFVSEYDQLIKEISSKTYDLIYANTVVSYTIGLQLKHLLKCRLILHVHELNTVIEEYAPDLSDFQDQVDLFVVPSLLNEKCLIEEYNIPSIKIAIVREPSDFNLVDKKVSDSRGLVNVLMCGGAYWRKGDDLFILTANSILKKNKDFQFFWVGYQSDERKRVNNADLIKLGIKDYVHFIDETEDTKQWYLNSDLFLLTSREDPFPLAAIEAGMMGLPIFCFEKATGISEVIDSKCVVPYLDIDLMATRILEVVYNPAYYEDISLENKTLFSTFKPENISNQIQKLVEELK